VGDQVTDTSRVSVLVVVPRDELDKVLVERDTGLGVKDGGFGRSDEIGRDELVFGVAEDTLEFTFRGSLHGSLDLLVSGGLFDSGDQVDDGDIRGGDSESHTGQLAVELGDDLADGLGGTGGGRDDVGGGASTTSPVLVGRTVDGLLGGGGGVNGGHQTLDDGVLVVQDLDQGGQTVGSARSVGDNVHVGLVGVQVDTTDEHGCVSGRSRDDDLLGTTLQVGGSLFGGGEDTSGLDNVVGAGLSPLDGGGVSFTVDSDGLAVNDELAVLGGDGTLESTVGRIVLEHVDHVVEVNEGARDGVSARSRREEKVYLLVDGDDFNVSVLYGISEDNSTDSTETTQDVSAIRPSITLNIPVDSNFDRHFYDRCDRGVCYDKEIENQRVSATFL
jgi:hypothetical protein